MPADGDDDAEEHAWRTPGAADDVGSSGPVPTLSMAADSATPRSECGIGALLPWADRLWAVTYPSHGPDTGSGHGLYEIRPDLSVRKHPASRVGTHANRFVHAPTDRAVVGPYVVDPDRTVRRLDALREDADGNPNRLTATMAHPEAPEERVLCLTMEGLLYEANVETLEVHLLADLAVELDLEGGAAGAHFKGGHTADGRVYVANNTYEDPEYRGERADGRLAVCDWASGEWETVARDPHMEVTGRENMGRVVFATGWDRRSAVLRVRTDGGDRGGGGSDGWTTYRLPKASRCFDHDWQTEWTRIREVETERYLLDCHGAFYELSPVAYGGAVWGVKPVCTHLRVIPDFCSFRGLLVLAGNQVSPNGANPYTGQPQSGLWVGATDDLWDWGKPQGWGGPWKDDAVTAREPSDPYLLTGFDEKVLHLSHRSDREVRFRVEVDFRGDHTWERYATVAVGPDGYEYHAFPDGFSAHWVRLVPDVDCTATAEFHYT
jgi:hypothetical protein